MRRLTMSIHRRRAASTPEVAKRRSYVAPSYESKYYRLYAAPFAGKPLRPGHAHPPRRHEIQPRYRVSRWRLKARESSGRPVAAAIVSSLVREEPLA